MGSIFPYQGAWRVQLSKGPRGHRKYVTRTVRTKAEARRVLDELRAAGAVPNGSTTTGAYLAQWVRDARNIRATTRHGYEAVVRTHLEPLIGYIPLADLRPFDVEHALNALEPKMSPKSLRNVHAVLRRALHQARRSGLVAHNVASREFVDPPKAATAEPRALSAEEVRRLLAVCADDPLGLLYVMAVGTGLRQGELLGLAWEDLDLEDADESVRFGPLHVHRSDQSLGGHRRNPRGASPDATDSVSRLHGDGLLPQHGMAVLALVHVRHELVNLGGGKYTRGAPKTAESVRDVPLAPSIVEALRRHRERLIADGFVPTATGPVFTNRRGGALSGSWVTHHFYGLLVAAGIPRLPFKNLRTTFSSRLSEAGVSDMEIARLMGHSRTHTTKKHYITLTGRSQAPAVEAIERLVAG